jgi:hypothetical protein
MFTIVLTRPDITFIIRKLSQFMSKLARYYGHALKFLMRYLRLTIKQRLYYSPRGVNKYLRVYSDID